MKACNSSMQLTRAADYGVRVMVHLATLRTDERALLRALADVTDAPESFLSKVLQALSRAGLISSWRGKSGGFLILPRGRAASMLEVVEAIDGRIHLNVCLDPEKGCARRAHCPAHPVWVQAQHAMAMQSHQAQAGLEQQKQAGAQKTLAQTAAMDEQKMVAKQAMDQFQMHSKRELMQQGHNQALEMANLPPEPKGRG